MDLRRRNKQHVAARHGNDGWEDPAPRAHEEGKVEMLRVLLNAWVTKTTAAEILARPKA